MDLITCEHCGMSWTERYWTWEEMTGQAPMGEGTPRDPHVCPKPYPCDIATSLAQFYAASGIPIHPQQKAAIKLGLETH